MILALLRKDLSHHLWAFLGVGLFTFCMTLIVLAGLISQQQDSLVQAIGNLCYYTLPMAIAMVVRRLVVVERLDGSHHFITALPVGPGRVALLRYALGLSWVMGLAAAGGVLVLLLVHRQQLLSLGWLLQVGWQCAAYLFAWYGLCFLMAQLGRYRFAAWMLLMGAVFTLDAWHPDAFNELTWHGTLAQSLDQTRSAPPWGGLALALGWGAAASVAGLLLAVARGGSLVDGWYRSMHARERAGVASLVIAGLVGMDLASDAWPYPQRAYDSIPAMAAERAVVRAAAAPGSPTWELGLQLALELDGLQQALGGDWREIVLTPQHQDPDWPVSIQRVDESVLVLLVDPSSSRAELLRRSLRAALLVRSARFADIDPERAWWLAGVPGWWLGDTEAQVLALRAAWAGAALQGPQELADPRALESRLGEDVFLGVAWARLQVMQEQLGRPQLLELLAGTLGRRTAHSARGQLGLMRAPAADALPAQLSVRALDRLHHAALQQLAVQHQARLRALPDPSSALQRAPHDDAEVAVSVSMSTPQTPDGVALRWATLDPLLGAPSSGISGEREPVDALPAVVPLLADRRSRLAVTLAFRVEALDGEMISGWQVLE